jgi:hypothetical protein
MSIMPTITMKEMDLMYVIIGLYKVTRSLPKW